MQKIYTKNLKQHTKETIQKENYIKKEERFTQKQNKSKEKTLQKGYYIEQRLHK